MNPSLRDEENLIDGQPEWWRQHLLAILGGLLIIALLGAAFVLWRSRVSLHESEAVLAVRQAPTLQTKLQNAEKFIGVKAIAPDLLLIASGQYAAGEYEPASSTYQLFLDNYKDHSLNNAARLGQAFAYEAAGKSKEALDGYLAAGDHRPADTYNALGLLNAARLYQAQENTTERRELLTRLTSEFPDSAYARDAQAQLESIVLKSAPAQAPEPAAAPTEASGS